MCREPHLKMCAVNLSREPDTLGAQMSGGTALILAVGNPGMDMPQIPTGMTHYASRVESDIGCAVYWNKECCRCIEFQNVRNAMTFTLSRDPLTLDGIGVALKQHDNQRSAAEIWSPWYQLRWPCIMFMSGPTRNALYAVALRDLVGFFPKHKYMRESKTQIQETCPTLTMTAALRKAHLQVTESIQWSTSD